MDEIVNDSKPIINFRIKHPFNDIEIECENGNILYFSKYVLCDFSEYFSTLLLSNFSEGTLCKENKLSRIKINKPLEEFETFLNYVSSRPTKLTEENIESLMNMANEYLSPHLMEKCESFLIRNLSLIDIALLINLMHLYHLKDLNKEFVTFYRENQEIVTKRILSSDRFPKFVVNDFYKAIPFWTDKLMIINELVKSDTIWLKIIDLNNQLDLFKENFKNSTASSKIFIKAGKMMREIILSSHDAELEYKLNKFIATRWFSSY